MLKTQLNLLAHREIDTKKMYQVVSTSTGYICFSQATLIHLFYPLVRLNLHKDHLFFKIHAFLISKMQIIPKNGLCDICPI